MILCELDYEADRRVSAAFRMKSENVDFLEFRNPSRFGREVDLANLRAVIDEAKVRFPDNPAASDAWLSPRVHAALRLTRREASVSGVWRFLGLMFAPDYVWWRWWNANPPDDDATRGAPKKERFTGPDYKQALARLWWMAELFRNGPEYGPAAKAMTNQDIPNNLFRMDIAHHRPTVQAAIAVLSKPDGTLMGGREANALAKAVNSAATTLIVDVIARDSLLDSSERERWIAEATDYDATRYFDDLPAGPDDPPAPTTEVEKVRALMSELFKEAPIRGKEKTQPETPTADVA